MLHPQLFPGRRARRSSEVRSAKPSSWNTSVQGLLLVEAFSLRGAWCWCWCCSILSSLVSFPFFVSLESECYCTLSSNILIVIVLERWEGEKTR